MQLKFNRYHITDGKTKVRVSYNLDSRIDSKKCVTIYAKDYGNQLSRFFPEIYQNDSDSMTDYFETGRVNLFEDHPSYKIARARVEDFKKKYEQQVLNLLARNRRRYG